jgi:DNA-binding MarR family transcriptional regulator
MRRTAQTKSTTPRALRAGNALENLEIPKTHAGRRVNNRPTLMRVLGELARHADHDTGAGARPSIARLADAVQVCRRTVQRALAALERLGLIHRTDRHSWRLRKPTTWAIDPDALREARKVAMEQIREKSAAYWAKLSAWKAPKTSKQALKPIRRQVCTLPSPIQGERREERSGEIPRASILDVLRGLQCQ